MGAAKKIDFIFIFIPQICMRFGKEKQKKNQESIKATVLKAWNRIDEPDEADYIIGIYVRVSTEEQAKDGYSIEFQIEKALIKAGVPKEKITDEYIEKAILKGGIPEERIKLYIDDGHTGEVLNRPGLDRLRDDAKAGILKKVICYDPDRWSRKLMVQLIITDELDRRNVGLVFVNGEYDKTPEGMLFYSMRGAISEFDKQKINRQLSDGRRRKAKKGKVLRDFRVYGYDYDKETAQMVVNEQEAAVVRLIFDLCTRPHEVLKGDEEKIEGFNGIAHYLMKKEIPTKRGSKVWHRQVVKQILMNPAYIGEFYQNKYNTEGMLLNKYRDPEDKISQTLRPKEEWIKIPCPTIIEKSQFNHAQKILEESKRRWAKKSRRKYLLSGLIRCGECGNTMVGIKSRNWGKDVLVYTCKKNTAGAKNTGCGRRPNCKSIDDEVWNTVHAWLNQPDEIAAVAAEINQKPTLSFEESEINRLEKEIEKAKSARKRLLKLYATVEMEEENGFSEEEIKRELRDWKAKEERCSRQLDELFELMVRNRSNEYNQQIFQEAAEYYLSKNPDQLSFEDKQTLVRMVVREVRSFKDHIEIYTF